MGYTKTRLWQSAPFIRLLIPFICGIMLQWHFSISIQLVTISACVLMTAVACYRYISVKQKFFRSYISGILLNGLMLLAGALLVWKSDIRNNEQWLGNHYAAGDAIVLTLEEPLVEKAASYKALASVETVVHENNSQDLKGTVILYFKKTDSTNNLSYGTRIITNKPLQEIANSGNPGGFDYKRYSLFNGITHQIYLTDKDYLIRSQKHVSSYKSGLYRSRSIIVDILKKYIPGEKEQGLAEALLIGYKDDLDKKLVEAYSNTGVVHVIAISGLHLGIIYSMLLWITAVLKRRKARWIRFIIIVVGLWSFSLLAGAQPSVLRSALMFSAIAFSTALHRQSSIYNTLALSAFCLLCWNPFWLWDVGFQLSYMAVLSIIIFFRPVYNWFYFPNKALDFIWKLMAVSLAAQILTLPISVYHFHQFPFLFLVANLLAVPLSSIILIGEIILCILSFLQPVAAFIGSMLSYLIHWMNAFVERLDKIPYGVWENLSISALQAVLLYFIIAAGAFWLLEKQKRTFVIMLCCLTIFMALRTASFWKAYQQQKLIVYNVPRHQAIDVIKGRRFSFIGDTTLAKDDFLRNFHIQPSRVLHRIQEDSRLKFTNAFKFRGKQVLIADTTLAFSSVAQKPVIDILVLSKNPRIYIAQAAERVVIRQVVSDGSVPPWKARLWKRDCDSLRIPFHDVTVQGAFVMDW